MLIDKNDRILYTFDGTKHSRNDFASMPLASVLAAQAGIKADFFYNVNPTLTEHNDRALLMEESAEFVENLGISTHDYLEDPQVAIAEMIEIFNSGDKVLALLGSPMDLVYQALEQTEDVNLSNIDLVSHSIGDERYNLNNSRTWQDLKLDFPQIDFFEIQNQGTKQGFNSKDWQWLDEVENPTLQEMRSQMKLARGRVNDPRDAGMLFYAITSNSRANPLDAKEYLNEFDNKLDSPSPLASDIVMEAENIALKGDWLYFDGGATYIGTDYRNQIPDGQSIDYLFQPETTGNYSLQLLPRRSDPLRYSDRDPLPVWLELFEAGETIPLAEEINLQAGIQYRLSLSGRVQGFALDKIEFSYLDGSSELAFSPIDSPLSTDYDEPPSFLA